MNDLISVIMPVKNVQSYIEHAVLSILQQTYENFELMIIEGESTDGTKDFLKTLEDKRIKIYFLDDISFIEKLNFGITKAKGTWIARMDGDDLSHPKRLEKLISYTKKYPNVNLFSSNYGFIYDNTLFNNYHNSFKTNEISKSDLTFQKSQFVDAAMLFNRQKAIDYDLYDIEFEKESSLWYKFLKNGKGILTSEQLYFYRYQSDQMTIKQNKNDIDWFKLRSKYDVKGYSKFSKFDNDISRKKNSLNNFIIIFTRKTIFLLLKKKYAKTIIFILRFLFKTKFNPQYFRSYIYSILGYKTLRFWNWKKLKRRVDYSIFSLEKDFI